MAVSLPPTGDIPLRHGYTLASIHELTLIAVHCELFYRARDYHERVDIAWSAIAEHLYASEQQPSRSDLIHAGMSAIASLFVSGARSHGINVSQRGRTAVPGTNFQKYWHLSTRPANGPEERIVERVALTRSGPRCHRGSATPSPRWLSTMTTAAPPRLLARPPPRTTLSSVMPGVSSSRSGTSTRRLRLRGDTTGADVPLSPRATLPASCAGGPPAAAPHARTTPRPSPKQEGRRRQQWPSGD